MKKNKFTLTEAKKLLLKKGLLIASKKRNLFFIGGLKSVYLSFASGLIFIALFFIMPFLTEINKNYQISSKEIKNNSKSNFEKVLVGEDIKKTSKIDEELDIKNLFDDIFQFDKLPNDTVRLSASTIEQLFKDTNYNLKNVRETKLVKPISLTLLPEEIKKIENTKRRKDLFIQIILPLIIDENNKIKIDRKKLFSILNKNHNTNNEKKWLSLKFKQYGVLNRDLSTLKVRMDEVPVSLAIAQAAKETGWGSSRFALEGNALFGQYLK